MDVIEGSLWELMLSTNDCYPGCSCDDDWFQQTPERVEAWITAKGTRAAEEALASLDSLLLDTNWNLEDLVDQTNYAFKETAEAQAWLRAWRPLLLKSLNSRSEETPASE